jgi:hypothetical protein
MRREGFGAIEKVVAQGGRQIAPLNLRHLFPEGHASQHFFDTFLFDGIGCGAELVR